MLNNNRVLITGATGFIGANLAYRLTKLGCKLNLTVRRKSNLWRIKDILPKVNLHYVDLTDKDEVEKIISKINPKVIYHCATYGGYPFQADLDKIIGTNIIDTLNLLNACLKVKFDCFINTGSSSEYGIKKHPMKESDLLEPINSYGVSKASATLFCQATAKRDNLPIVTLRLFSPYGYYEEKKRLIPTVVISCLNRINPKLSSPNSARDFVFIDDVIDAYIKITKNIKKVKGKIINISSGRQHSVKEIVEKIIKLTDSKVSPEWNILKNPRIEPEIWQADINKARNLLGWLPKYNLEQGLKKTIEWFRNNMEFYK